MTILETKDLKKIYGAGEAEVRALDGVDITVEKGEFVAVMGPSGSGKTTLLNCISRFIPYDEGAVLLGGEDISRLKEDELAKVRNRKMGFVFQDFMLLDGLTVFENICLPQIIDERPVAQMESKAENICRIFGIDKIMQKYPAEISGGEKQRTAVARALMNHPLVILADEPTGNLDSKSCRAVIDAFLKARDTMQATVFMVTHDSFAASFCDRVIILKDGQVSGIRENRGDRKVFMDELLDTIRVLGGDFDDNE